MFRSSSSGCGAERDLVAESHELANKITGATAPVHAPLVEVRAEVGEAGVRVGEEVPHDDEDRTRHGDEGALTASAGGFEITLDAENRMHAVAAVHQLLERAGIFISSEGADL